MSETSPTSAGLADCLPALLQSAGVVGVELHVLARPPKFQGGEVSERARELTGPARDEHRTRGFGFWEFVLSASVGVDRDTRLGLIDGALRHNSDDSIRISMATDEFVEHLVGGDFDDLPPRSLVSLYSPVQVRDRAASLHLPMLDLGVRVGSPGEAAATDVVRSLGMEGVLLDSGRSYHFYGVEPVSEQQLVAFLARAQLLSPIVDTRWVSHQLLDRRCGLRISTNIEGRGVRHRLVGWVGGAGSRD